MTTKLGFFGGCFNPVTNAHINLVKNAISQYNLSKVYFVPMGDLYPKKDLILLKHRIKMLELALENEDKIEILNISNNDKKTYFIDTIKIIEEKFSEAEIFFIMGSDNFVKMTNWKSAEELKKYKYIILDRKNGNTKDISSTIIRKKIKLDEDIESLVPVQIIRYIKENNLYK